MLLVILSILSRRLQNVNFLTFDVKLISDRVGTVLTSTYSVRFCFVLHAKTMLAVLYVKMCVVQQQQCFSGENVSEGSGQFNVGEFICTFNSASQTVYVASCCANTNVNRSHE